MNVKKFVQTFVLGTEVKRFRINHPRDFTTRRNKFLLSRTSTAKSRSFFPPIDIGQGYLGMGTAAFLSGFFFTFDIWLFKKNFSNTPYRGRHEKCHLLQSREKKFGSTSHSFVVVKIPFFIELSYNREKILHIILEKLLSLHNAKKNLIFDEENINYVLEILRSGKSFEQSPRWYMHEEFQKKKFLKIGIYFNVEKLCRKIN